MRKINSLLTYFPLTSEQLASLRALLPDAEIVRRNRENISPEDVNKAEVIFGNVPARMLQENNNLKWLHLSSAGTDGYLEAIDYLIEGK